MKKITLILVAVVCAFGARGQMTPMSSIADSASLFEQYSATIRQQAIRHFADTARGIKMHGRWENFWSNRVDNSARTVDSLFLSYGLAMGHHYAFSPAQCIGSPTYTGNWKPLGPSKDYFGQVEDNAGRITALWVSPTDTNYILAGAAAGGLWKTTDGGKNWANITDGWDQYLTGTTGVTSIAVDPLNVNRIYIAIGNTMGFNQSYPVAYSSGILFSEDGGATWSIDGSFRTISGTGSTYGYSKIPILKMGFGLLNRLYVLTRRAIYVRYPSGIWYNITPPEFSTMDPNYMFADFEFSRLASSGNQLVLATTSYELLGTQYLFNFNQSSATWAPKRAIVMQPGDSPEFLHGIGITSTDSICIVVKCVGSNTKLYKTALSSGAFLRRNNSLISDANDIFPSANIEGLMYLMNANGYPLFLQKTTNRGETFSNAGSTHADGRVGIFYSAGTSGTGLDDVLFFGTDGGIAKKSKGHDNFHSLSGKGLNITQFYGLANNRTNDAMLSAGAQDNGTWNWMRKRSIPWDMYMNGDGLLTAFSRNGDSLAYIQNQYRVSGGFRFKPAINAMVGVELTGNPPDQPLAGDKYRRWMRPIQFDQHNIARVGFHFIFKKDHYGTEGWKPSFSDFVSTMHDPKPSITMSTDAANIALLRANKKPVDFIISEHNPSIGYIAYDNVRWEVDVPDIQVALFASQNLHAAPVGSPFWEKIIPWTHFHKITDIEIDPIKPNRLWIAYGGVNMWEVDKPASERDERVLFTDDYGATFNDVSKGLPALPIHKLVFIPGSDDVLFAATEVGVYRWNKAAAQWECFNTGLPGCIVSDIEYLSCSGKLRISTWGRGVWETPISPDMHNYIPGDVYTITTNTTWSQSKTVEGNIRIKPGATLTISGAGNTIFMPRNGRIYVEKGAKLVLDAARITNDCDSCRWEGIILSGNKFAAPTPANQGYFEMKNGAIIENAGLGVRDFDDSNLQGGGIILASNSTFLNCWKAVGLNDYPNYPRASTCSFNNVTFKVSNNKPMEARTGVLPPHQFTAFAERGIVIDGCTFVDERDLETSKLITAIASTDADYKVTNSTFTHMRRGIYAETIYATALIPKPTILNNTFVDVQENITMYVTNPVIRGNNFSRLRADVPFVGPPLVIKKSAWAVYLDGTRGANVVNNYIEGHPSSILNVNANRLRYGVIAKNTGSNGTYYGGKIMNNSFYNLFSGVQTESQNMNLFFNCNGFTRHTYAATINPSSGGMWVAPGTNILQSQNGGCGTFYTRPNNSFSNNSNGIYSWITNPGQYLTYYLNSTGPAAYIPALSGGGFTPLNCTGLGTVDANRICNLESVEVWDQTKLNLALNQYNLHKGVNALSAETWFYRGELMRAYTELDNLAGLKSFLIADNTDESRFQLIPIYIQEASYQTALNTITAMSIDQTEKTAMTSYFNVMIALKQSNRRPNQLTPAELSTMHNIANGGMVIANAAKGLLEWGYEVPWDHVPEEIPMQPMSYVIGAEETIKSRLGNATPNPVKGSVEIPVFITEFDAATGCQLVIHDVLGKAKATYKLKEGDNIVVVNTDNWATGLYTYSLFVNNSPAETKKFSKVQ